MTSRKRGLTLEQRFWAKVDKDGPNGCWEWTAAKNSDGYGYITHDNAVSPRAHRLSWVLHNGPVPAGLVLDHLCRNRACVNPAHLELVTDQVNIRRGYRASKTHCKNGHEFDDANTRRRPDGSRACRTCARLRKTAMAS